MKARDLVFENAVRASVERLVAKGASREWVAENFPELLAAVEVPVEEVRAYQGSRIGFLAEVK